MDDENANRFFSKVDIPDDENNCWNWLASTNKYGYGQFSYNGTMCRANRVSYEHFYGDIEGDQLVRHTCHNRKCVNPRHLELGDHIDNRQDAIEAGRMPGINKETIKKIKSLARTTSHYKISLIIGVSRRAIDKILRKDS
ncbi:MAG: HNH endonuclease [Candidatus Izemoplasmatales bacterium]|jgi:hypothetical protein